MRIDRFNIRVYGLLVHAGQVLVSDEVHAGQAMTKFPGGGVEYGEGPVEALVREIQEEMGLKAFGLEHFYTTEHFQRSAFRPNEQIISLYYRFQVLHPGHIRNGDRSAEGGHQVFRWLTIPGAQPDAVTFPIDRIVLERLVAAFRP